MMERTEIDDYGCWVWRGSVATNGYGQMAFHRDKVLTHRVSMWVAGLIELDSPVLVLHRCNKKLCWNPDHLYVGTQEDNVRDSMEDMSHNAAMKRLQSHCKNGHEFNEANTKTYLDSKGRSHRECRACRSEYNKNYIRIR